MVHDYIIFVEFCLNINPFFHICNVEDCVLP